MERFNNIYPFTTENISGYMRDLDLTDKKIITVTGSADHILNAVLKGATKITTFDVNPLTEKYMDLKIGAVKELTYDEFLKIFLFDSNKSFEYSIISNLNIPIESKLFWLEQLKKYNNNGKNLRNSSLFNTKYLNPNSKLWQNMYLEENNYNILKERLKDTEIKFINESLKKLRIKEDYDYMFLSNISDYLNLMYDKNLLESYKRLLKEFQYKVKTIYFAYLYDIGNNNPRSEIDDLNKVKKVFSNFEKLEFRSALEMQKENIKDGVLILRR